MYGPVSSITRVARRTRIGMSVVLAGLWIGLLAPVQAEAPMSLDDIVTLRKLGFTESQLRGELAPHKGAMAFDEAAVPRLSEAGLSTEFIDFLRSLAPEKRMNNDDVARMLAQGDSAVAVLRAIASSKREFDGSAPALLALNRKAALPASVAKAMRGEPLTVEGIRQLAAEGTPETEIDILVSMLGMAPAPLTPADALDLTKAGLSNDVVAHIRESAARPAQTAPEPKPVALGPGDFSKFDHITGLFELHYPRDWYFSRLVDTSLPVYYATPSRGVTDPTTAETLLALTLSPLKKETADTPEQWINIFNAITRQSLKDFEPVDKTVTVEHGAYQEYLARIGETPIRGRIYALGGRDQVYYLSLHAPLADFPRELPRLEYAATNLAIVTRDGRGSNRLLSSQDVVRRYEESIVQVNAWDDGSTDRSQGTGFFVRKDGYLVTNAHVVLDAKTLKPKQNFEVRWPDRMNRDPERAELVGVQSPREGRLSRGWFTGNDMAILRITSTKPLQTIPLVPTEDVALGDQVVVIGYPLSSLFGAKLETTVTSGVVTRFQRNDEDEIQTIVSDVIASGGNSGGPVISLARGGAIGLLTQGTTWHTKTDKAAQYSGVLPASTVMRFYPEETLVEAERSVSMDFFDAYDLALRAYQGGRLEGAEDVARRAIQRRPQDANGYWLLAQILLERADSDEDRADALDALKRALDIDRRHVPSLITQSAVELDRDDSIAALRYVDRGIEVVPRKWPMHFMRAQINLRLERYDQALADLDKAREFSGELIPEPFSLAGTAHYLKEEYEKGKEKYEKAVALAPKNVDARLGIGQYYVYKKQYANALIEFDRLNSDVSKVPEVLGWMGYAYSLQGNFSKAKDFLWSSLLGYQRETSRKRATPPQFVYENLADVSRKDRDPSRAIIAYSRLIHFYGTKLTAEETVDAREYLGEQARDKHPQVTRLHLVAARDVAREATNELRKRVSEQLDKIAAGTISMDDIVYMAVERSYHAQMVVDMILDDEAKLGFAVPGGTTARGGPDDARLKWLNEQIEKHRLSPAVVIALHVKTEAAKKEQKDGKDGDKKNDTVSLVGSWQGPDREGRAWVFNFEPTKNDKRLFKLSALENGRLTDADSGEWRISQVDGKQVLALQSNAQNRQVNLPLSVGKDDAGWILYITFGNDKQDFRQRKP